jgi:3-hydroxyacyl-[acyl-carrier-protein] dehydratase
MLGQASAFNQEELVALLPQTAPFRFVDRIIEIDERHVHATASFRGDEYFYAGHFRGDPVTPGVILLEAMAQSGVVLQALYLFSRGPQPKELSRMRTVLTDFAGEIYRPVVPPQCVTIRSELVLWRAHKIRCKVKMFNDKQHLIATAVISGMGVPIA